MLESILSFSSLYLISHSLRICSQISTNFSNDIFSIKYPENIQKMFVNNETLQKLRTELD